MLLGVLFFGTVVIALYFNSLGANAPVIMEFYGISYARYGFVMTMQSVGAFLGAAVCLVRGERYNKFNIAAAGLLLFGAASFAIGFAPPYLVLVIIIVLCGFGGTAADVIVNGIIAEFFPKRKNTLLPILHAFFGAGAMASPLIVTLIVQPDIPSTFGRPLLLFGAMGILAAILFFFTGRRVLSETPYADMDKIRRRGGVSPIEFFKEKKARIFLLAAILYCSFQIGVVSWLPSFGREMGMDFNTAGAMLTAFFAGSLVMRFCGALILKKIPVRIAYVLFCLISAVVVAAGLFMTTPGSMMVLIIIGGFMQGSSIAFLVLMSTDAFPDRAASASSLTFMGLSIAAMITPLWMGSLAELTGFRIPLLLGCALVAVSGIIIIPTGSKGSDKTA